MTEQDASPGVAGPEPRRAPRGLGALESQIMNALWDSTADLSVQEVCTALGPGHNYKTVMTVLNRLVEKQLLERQLDGRAFRYRPTYTRQQFLRSVADELVRGYLESYGSGSASHLARAVDSVAPRSTPPPAAPLTLEIDEPPRVPIAWLLAAIVVLETLVVLLRREQKR